MSQKIQTIIDNRNRNTVLNSLIALLEQTKNFDIATGTLEIGSLVSLEGIWQNLEKIRIVMGDETTKRTKGELIEALKNASDESIEIAKEKNDDLSGLEAIREAINQKKILVRVYPKAKFHAKCYLMESKETSPVDFALVGSSNFTNPGLTQNVELNLFTSDQVHIEKLREWYNEIWGESETVNAELLKVMEPHLREYDPFTVYARALFEYFAGRERTQDDWELTDSIIYPKLSQYQKDGYHRALQIADSWSGALICDGVGLGKTYIGLMILERFIKERKPVLLIVPKSAEQSVWRRDINRFLSNKYSRELRESLDIRRHTDFGREGIISNDDLDYFRAHTEAIIIDETHHFRNPKANRGRLLMDLAANKRLFLLSATPINNSLDDLYHLINYFAQNKPDYFSKIRINNLRRHFLDNEKRLSDMAPTEELTSIVDQEDFLRTDELLKNVLIQRSRKYVKNSETENGNMPLFPERQKPQVVSYSLKEVYHNIYGEIKDAFDKKDPLLSLAIYNTSDYNPNPDKVIAQSQQQVIGLIRTLLLKRLESSFKSFEASLEDLLEKMARFLRWADQERYDAWDHTNRRWWKIVQDHITQRLEKEEEEETEEDNEIPDYMADFNPDNYDMDSLLRDLEEDMRILTDFLSKLYRRFYEKENEGLVEDPTKDDKLQQLLHLIKEDPKLKKNKILIFTEFKATARYLERQLSLAGLKNVEQVDSGRNVKNREDVIKRFAPYYNCLQNKENLFGETELSRALENPISILISTDVLSEGLNLQDCSLLINYDLHWNPVRLMQRIGRVDRRLDPEIELEIKRPKSIDRKIYFWNFLPPNELEDLLHLKKNLDGKILRINRTLGIEGALLTPDDEEMTLKDFNEKYEGKETIEELMNLERQKIASEHPELWDVLSKLPRRLFSGKLVGDGFDLITNRRGDVISHLKPQDTKGLFCCYRMPVVLGEAPKDLFEQKHETFDESRHSKGEVRWYFYDNENAKITESLEDCWTAIRCKSGTPRNVIKGTKNLSDIRIAIEKHIKNTYLKDIQAPIGSKPILLAWIEVS